VWVGAASRGASEGGAFVDGLHRLEAGEVELFLALGDDLAFNRGAIALACTDDEG
jgi:hypothetical protein